MPDDAAVDRLRRERDDLLRVCETARLLNSTLEPSALLDMILDGAIELAGAERGFLVLREGPDRFHVAAARGLGREEVEAGGSPDGQFSRTVVERVLEEGRGLVAENAGADDRFAAAASVQGMSLRSVLAVPLRVRDETVGALYLDNRAVAGAFREGLLRMIGVYADQAGVALRNARAHRDLSDRAAMQARELAEARPALAGHWGLRNLVGRSAAMRRVADTIRRVGDSDVPVLVLGESGTGKELVARTIHALSARAGGPFVSENCAALTETLLESELFGHVRGAFTGADTDRPGLFRTADGGTLFLDEIAETSPGCQGALLRALQEGEVRPVGGSDPVSVDVRVITATNADLERDVEDGSFRQDLFYRLNTVALRMPPLRERREDVPLLVEHFLDERFPDAPPPEVSGETMARLVDFDWPGNVRQLENEVERMLALRPPAGALTPDLLSDVVRGDAPARDAGDGTGDTSPAAAPGPLDRALAETERVTIERALAACDGNRTAAAEMLHISRGRLRRKMTEHGIRT